MQKASKALEKDAKHYEKKMENAPSSTVKKHEKIEMKEAKSASKDMKKRAKTAHEY